MVWPFTGGIIVWGKLLSYSCFYWLLNSLVDYDMTCMAHDSERCVGHRIFSCVAKIQRRIFHLTLWEWERLCVQVCPFPYFKVFYVADDA